MRRPRGARAAGRGVSGGCARLLAAAAGCGAALLPAALAVTGCGRAPARVAPAPVPIHEHAAVSGEDRERYLGSKACVSCHPAQAGQQESRHARTLSRVDPSAHGAQFRVGGEVFDPMGFVTYTPAVKDGGCVLEAEAGGRRASGKAAFAFGSGNRGTTYLGEYRGQRVELRLSYYSAHRKWAFTPGQQPGARIGTPVGRTLSADEEEECFRCHTTALVRSGSRLDLDRSLLGVGCESCHGPGREHVEAVKRGDPEHRMARLSGARERLSVALCGQCHRSPADDDPANPNVATQLARFQGMALGRSACFQASAGKLTCGTCHDPHRDAARDSLVEYDRACSSCHEPGAAGQKPCPVQPRAGCVGCHMPAQAVDIPTRPRFRTHWIRVWPESRAPQP